MPPRIERSAGTRIGRYTLVAPLGSGGNAEVWRARAEDQSDFALKILRQRNPESEPYRRLVSEIEALKRIGELQGVLPMLDHSLPTHPSREQPAWISLPIASPIQDELQKSGGLSRVVECVHTIASTLVELEGSHGIHHRDIKPENLYFRDGAWCIGDFGLVTFPDKESITATERHIGPLYYLAPEVFSQQGRQFGPTDVYALAKTLWVLATGQTYPLPGDLTPDIEQFRIGSFSVEAGTRTLDLLVGRSTQVDPGQRPTMQEFASELAAWRTLGSQQPDQVSFQSETMDRLAPLVRARISATSQRDQTRSYVQGRRTEIALQMRALVDELSSILGIEPERDVTSFGDVPEIARLLEVRDPNYHCYTTYAFHIPAISGGPEIAASVVIGVAIPVSTDNIVHSFGGTVLLVNKKAASCTLTSVYAAVRESAQEVQAVNTVITELRSTALKVLADLTAFLERTS